ncbi:hypothetical protein QE152_g31390 [Popillia japonica]|uniref:Uncharacterized protein n=1 Tax=Popillia japonica TaxID=7064 RepID=A0AAW1J306_POPJA
MANKRHISDKELEEIWETFDNPIPRSPSPPRSEDEYQCAVPRSPSPPRSEDEYQLEEDEFDDSDWEPPGNADNSNI